ncbi:MAG: alpha-(1-_3)-arabinofuranosyltransferase family protein, partial [Ilumatobacteraceae bacterium]
MATQRSTSAARWWAALAVGVLALLAYLPALRSSPGRMPADTKLYLYLDPGRLIGDAPWTFDGRQFAGWVPHQVIAYLWPQGPWFWLGSQTGLPDWVVHRLWLGTLFLAAGTGVLWVSRRVGLGPAAAFAAALVYQLAPYVLPYESRTSAMLLPWAGLGWIVGLTVLAATRSRWRHAALAALVVASVGAVNATALLMVAPAPVLWLLIAAGERRVTWKRVATTAAKIGGLSLAVSLWWITAVIIQGRQGADVLAYSESLESVSYTSTSPEVWRGLGYWLTYVRDAYAATTTAGRDYMVSGRLIVTGYLLAIVGVAGLVLTRWSNRRFAVALIVSGVILGVGVHPIDDPSPMMGVLLGDGTSGAALALRSSTRAVPMLVLGLALGAGSLVDALGGLTPGVVRRNGRRTWSPPRWLTPGAVSLVAVGLLALANLPVLTGHRLVDPAIDRDEDPPAAWLDATAALDADATGGRVLQLPGQEFGAFRWGYTVDPPLPGLTDRPLVTRDLLPLGSAPAMDLLYALDDRFQSGIAERDAVAPVARLLGADTIWLTGDVAFERFRTPRPEITHDQVAQSGAGLGPPVPYGAPVADVPDIPMVDEQSVSDRRVGLPIPPVELVPVEDPEPVIRVKDDVVLVSGSGDGLVDAAAAGLIDGHELVRYTGSLSGTDLGDAASSASHVIVTDSNRQRAREWRGSQDVVGMTEDDDPRSADVIREDPADQRLPVFGPSSTRADASTPTGTETVAIQDGPVRARATAYGEPFAYRPEDRAVMAVDGDPTTAWRVADRADPLGEAIVLDVAQPIDHLVLQQPAGAGAVRHIGRVSISVDGAEPVSVELDDRSLGADGQRVDITPTAGAAEVRIAIEAVVVPDQSLGPALASVGFAEIGTGLAPTVEVVRVPSDGPTAVAGSGTPLSFVLTRQRTRPTDRWRSDPEPAIVREIELVDDATFDAAVTVRLDQRASDAVLADLFASAAPTASRRLVGAASAGGWAAVDADPETAWTTTFESGVGSALGATLHLVADTDVQRFELTQPGGDHSPITGLRLHAGGTSVVAAVPPPDETGTSVVELPAALPSGPVEVEITSIEPHWVLDRRYGEPVVMPTAVGEISIGPRTTLDEKLDTGCRDDLVAVDGHPLPVRIEADVATLVAGGALTVGPCDGQPLALGPGPHRVTSTAGAVTGLQVDRIVLAGTGRPPPASPTDERGPTVTVRSSGRTSRDVTVDRCPDGCWLVLGEGLHPSWSASTADGDLGPAQLVDGGFNGWWIAPSDGPVDVAVRWTAQTPLTVALVLTALAVLACIALAVADRRRVDA